MPQTFCQTNQKYKFCKFLNSVSLVSKILFHLHSRFCFSLVVGGVIQMIRTGPEPKFFLVWRNGDYATTHPALAQAKGFGLHSVAFCSQGIKGNLLQWSSMSRTIEAVALVAKFLGAHNFKRKKKCSK